jgi:D-3-phosphoglycerate dehydrogenase
LKDVHFLGIRSRTELTEEMLAAAPKLTAIGCFCIGTNQVDLAAAAQRGIPVFNAPYSNTRSVAELVLGEAIMLLRGIPGKSALVHRGGWTKSAEGSVEVRGKTLGIVGYGHIGTQLGMLAEHLGMQRALPRHRRPAPARQRPPRAPSSTPCSARAMSSPCTCPRRRRRKT